MDHRNVIYKHWFYLRRLKLTAVEARSDANETSTRKRSVQEGQYTDLQGDHRASRDYTELELRNDNYSNIGGDGHAYVNTNMQA